MGHFYNCMGIYEEHRNYEYQKALRLFQQALRHWAIEHCPSEILAATFNLINLYYKIGEVTIAEDLNEKYQKMYVGEQGWSDIQHLILTSELLEESIEAQSNLGRATKQAVEAVDMAHEIGNKKDIADANRQLGNLYWKQNEKVDAVKCWKISVGVYQELERDEEAQELERRIASAADCKY